MLEAEIQLDQYYDQGRYSLVIIFNKYGDPFHWYISFLSGGNAHPVSGAAFYANGQGTG